ncbi:MAG: hypothetical protein JW808_10735 [Victivallales bacterium]|nr:hypothetical protein [Victivallales bacterium]
MTRASYSEAIRHALSTCMSKDKNIFCIGEDIGVYGGAFGVTRGMIEKFGSGRIIDSPLSEAGFVGVAIGAAMLGARPVVEIMFMDFITLAVDQLVNQSAKLRYVFGPQSKCPVVIRVACGAGRGYGPTHSQTFAPWFCQIPGIKVFAPSSVQDAHDLMRQAIYDDNPVVFLEHKQLYAKEGDLNTRLKGKPAGTRVLKKGSDISIVAYSLMTDESLSAAGILDADGISAEVLGMGILSPMDIVPVVESVKKTGRLLVAAEEHNNCGVAAEIACRVVEQAYDYLDAPICRLTLPDIPIPASPALEHEAMPDKKDIAEAAKRLVES